ncbi:MAG: excinuclease ABC subunit UvrA [Oligoflexia bacterium]|nr:excinuclease ABC subunit UvrA [Oligoflexia bacterium]
MKEIVLQGAKQNNLKNISVRIPLGSFTVICGPSGSGKSSLAFETLYAEGQRRYIESLSTYARQFLNKAPKPDVEFVQNIPPAIAIEQKNHVKNSRSTVGTTTEILDYLRLLYEKIGTPMCPNGHGPIKKDSVSDGATRLLNEMPDARAFILFPVTEKMRVVEGKKLLALIISEGYLRITKPKSQEIIDLDAKSKLPATDFFVVIDRLVVNEQSRGRLVDSLSQAYAMSLKFNHGLGGGYARVRTVEGQEIPLSEEISCSICSFTLPPINSRLFSFSSPYGACTTCNGFGNILTVDELKVIPNPQASIAQQCIEPLAMPSSKGAQRKLIDFARKNKINLETPWVELPEDEKKLIWEGGKGFYGVMGFFEYLEEKRYKMHVRVFLSRFKSPFLCEACHGTRLRPEANMVLLNGKPISALSLLTLQELHDFFTGLKLAPQEAAIALEVFKQVQSRLSFLIEVGVDYLTLDRLTRSLSGGEYQRIHLANQLGMGLSQTLYVLDEPTVGLHPRDNLRLINILKKLRRLGNTLVIVEHDRDVIQHSSHVIEMGPGSGHLGGEVLNSDTTEMFLKNPKSLTASYLRPTKKSVTDASRRPMVLENFKYKIELKGCSGNNLKNIDVTFPLNRLVCVTGVSGSGKSTLVTDTLYPALARSLQKEFDVSAPFKKLTGAEFVKNIMLIDQKPIGKSSRSNPVTYLKVYDDIRAIMASTSDSKQRGYTPGFFSFNVDGGRCPVCRGEGVEIIDMVFMEEVALKCDACDGRRFKKEILEVRYNGKNIDNILRMTVTEAMDFFVNYPNIRRPLSVLREVGLEYITLGQPAPTLSGGESQRLKIAKEFQSSQQRATLYILDEPTTGLHFREVDMLLNVINRLIDSGGSVIVIEHNLEVIRNSDFIIDLGPEGGAGGGQIVAQGTPHEIAKVKNSHTGLFLKEILNSN